MKNDNILLLHGALGSKLQLDSLKHLLSHHFNVFTLNFEGHGDKPSDKEFSIDLFAQNVKDFLKAMNISSTHIFGYSMGGYVTLRLALNNPSLVNQIMTLGTKFNWTKEIAEQEVKMLNPEKLEEKVPAFAKRLEEIHTGIGWKSVLSKTAKMMSELGNGKKISDEDLSRIGQNVLIGIGELDRMVTIDESEQASNLMPNGNLKVIEGFKHPIEKVDMDQLARIIMDYLNNE